MRRIAVGWLISVVLVTVVLAAVPSLLGQATDQAAAREKVNHFIRERFSIPDSVKITSTDLRETAYPDFWETTVTLDDGKDKRTQPFYVSKNLRYVVEGGLYNLGGNPRELILRLMSLHDQAAQGPPTAPVTLVEYSDLECPVCATLHQDLENKIIPKYGDKLRVVFKELPLVNIHEWALPAAIAAQCVYQIDPSRYADFRTAVYKSQASMTSDHARDMLLHFGAEAGVDNVKLAACLDAKATLPRVQASMEEGFALGVSQTPTSFVNGRLLVGAPGPDAFYKLIDEALHDAK